MCFTVHKLSIVKHNPTQKCEIAHVLKREKICIPICRLCPFLGPEVEGKREAINYHSQTSSHMHTSAWKGSSVYPTTLPEPAAAPRLWVTGYDTLVAENLYVCNSLSTQRLHTLVLMWM